MQKKAKWFIGCFFLCFAFLLVSRFTLNPIAYSKRHGAQSQALVSQVFSGVKPFLMMRLWNQAEEAKSQGKWFKTIGSFNAMERLEPSNIRLSCYIAETEALFIAPEVNKRMEAWTWVQQALQRLQEKEEWLPNQALFCQQRWWIGFYMGQRFPLHYAKAIIALEAEEEVAKRLQPFLSKLEGEVSQAPELFAFLEDHGLIADFSLADSFQKLDLSTQNSLFELEALRWSAMLLALKPAFLKEKSRSSQQTEAFFVNLHRLSEVSKVQQMRRQIPTLFHIFLPEASSLSSPEAWHPLLRSQASEVLTSERQRLQKLGISQGEIEAFAMTFQTVFPEWFN